MIPCRKIYTSPDRALDLQIVEIINAVSGQGTSAMVVRDPTTGTRYSMSVALMRDDAGDLILSESGNPVPQLILTELPP